MSNQAAKVSEIKKSEILDNQENQTTGISYKTIGTTLQALSVQLDEGESVISEAGKMAWMTNNVKMSTKSQGIKKVFSRIFASESLFVNEYSAESGTGLISFSTGQAGKIIPINLEDGDQGVIFQRGSYLCSELGIDRSTVFIKKFSAGLFGGKGFILQKLSGKGRSHLIADGEVVMYDLKDGETILVDQGNLVAYEENVDFDIRTVGGGAKNWFFGGEGIFLGSLTGPGKVWLQTRKLTIHNAATRAAATNGGRSSAASNPLGCIIGVLITGFFLVFGIIVSLLANL